MKERIEEHWKELSIKDKVSYYVAFALILSAIVLAFLSFFLNAYDIATGILIYIAQCFVIGGGLIGASVYFKSKWVEFNTNAVNEIKNEVGRHFGNMQPKDTELPTDDNR